MHRMIMIVGLLVLLTAQPAQAQVIIGPGFGVQQGWQVRSGIGFGWSGRHFAVRGFWGSSYTTGFHSPGFISFGPAPIWNPYWGFVRPGWGYVNPGWGFVRPPWGFVRQGWGFAPWQPPVVVIPQAPVIVNVGYAAPRPEPRVRAREEDFVAIRPVAPAEAPMAPPPAPVAPAPVPMLLRAPRLDEVAPAADALNAAITRGKEALARGEYGRAVEWFARAQKAQPREPWPHVLLGQAHLARGEYLEAVQAIERALELEPGLPRRAFQPRDLYGDQPDRYQDHLNDLRQARLRHPHEPRLAFLLAYQLWFGGVRDEAVQLLRELQPRANALPGLATFQKAMADPSDLK